MKLAALFSGGKDSTFAMFKAKQLGHEIKYLATVHSANPYSFMYHTPNIGLTVLQSKAMGIPLVSKETKGEKEQELHDLKILLSGLEVEGVVSGAVASEYQKKRVDRICKELGLKSIAPLWKRNAETLLEEMIDNGFKIIITAVAAEGFDESWLGRRIDEKCLEELKELNRKFEIHITGEGGEFETLVVDCPMFKKRLVVRRFKKIWDGTTGHLLIKDAKLNEKSYGLKKI